MTEVISLAGLRQLRLKQRSGEPMPEGWQDSVRQYVSSKRKLLFLLSHPTQDDEIVAERRAHCRKLAAELGIKNKPRESLKSVMENQLKEAEMLSHLMGVSYVYVR